MNARSAVLLEQAKQQGYLVMRYSYNKTLKAHYFHWCQSQKIPAIYVWFHGQAASFDTNTEPVFLGYFDSETDGDLFDSPDFTSTPELEDRLSAISKRWLEDVPPCSQKKAKIYDGQAGRHISPEMAIEAAKELWDIWQEAKQHLVFVPD